MKRRRCRPPSGLDRYTLRHEISHELRGPLKPEWLTRRRSSGHAYLTRWKHPARSNERIPVYFVFGPRTKFSGRSTMKLARLVDPYYRGSP